MDLQCFLIEDIILVLYSGTALSPILIVRPDTNWIIVLLPLFTVLCLSLFLQT